MKVFNIILIVIALGLIIYNATLIDFADPLAGDSAIALIGVVAALCAVLLLIILNISKKIQDKVREKK